MSRHRYMLFSELGLGTEVLRAIEEKGYTQPTPIQEQAIPWVLQGRDVLGCAQTGTGKTAGFTLPMIDILATGRARARMPRSLILEPTRELAAQVAESFEVYGKYHRLSMALLIGGENFADQIKRLDRGVDVLIATPGRLIDLFERGNILLTDIKVLVIDEADRMLDMGFIPDIERIVSLLPRSRQTLFFSATMPPEIRRLADAFLDNPKQISVAPPSSTSDNVVQAHVRVAELDKRKALRHLLRTEDVKNAFIFCNRKRDIAVLQKSLERHGFNAGALHGDMPQHKRTETLDLFKKGEITLLVCSDVAARGLDVKGLSHVFNFDVPINAEDYVHRIGRTGRAGLTGRSYTIAGPEDGRAIAAITQLIGKEIPLMDVDGVETIAFEEGEGRGRGRGGRGGRRDERGRDGNRGGGDRRPAGRRDERSGEERPRDERPREERPRDERPREERPRDERPREERHRDDRQQRVDHHREERAGDDRARGGQHRRDHADRESERRIHVRRDMPRDSFREQNRDDRRDRRRHHDDDGGPPVIGFGDHVPSFILREGRSKRPNGAATRSAAVKTSALESTALEETAVPLAPVVMPTDTIVAVTDTVAVTTVTETATTETVVVSPDTAILAPVFLSRDAAATDAVDLDDAVIEAAIPITDSPATPTVDGPAPSEPSTAAPADDLDVVALDIVPAESETVRPDGGV